uniref:ER membrane protein complex subunit 2 n=1 Tax=Phallusia mammillata TaxID=59560 RepID=A0A6F9DCQ2_9ASCI|nr:ER membrane protein complex subunit 2-like [Phallusia mammillata]
MDMTWDEASDTLREWRGMSVRDSEQVVELGERLVRDYSSKLQDELWLVCEQVFIASLDTGRFDLANLCLDKLKEKFPKSSRVMKLDAMGMEAEGRFDDALNVYDELEKLDQTDAAIRKRKIAVFKSQGYTSLAIKHLTIYLQSFMADQEAWMELADLYVKEMDYKKAAFCVEELILSNAFNHLYHQRYAEIMYTIGGQENLETARRYFAQAVKLSSNTNIRALYGLMLTSGSSTQSRGDTKARNSKQYANWAGKMVLSKYKNVWSEGGTVDETKFLPKITPESDLPQLTASVSQMLGQISLSDASS